jgi:hypothetical protein
MREERRKGTLASDILTDKKMKVNKKIALTFASQYSAPSSKKDKRI